MAISLPPSRHSAPPANASSSSQHRGQAEDLVLAATAVDCSEGVEAVVVPVDLESHGKRSGDDVIVASDRRHAPAAQQRDEFTATAARASPPDQLLTEVTWQSAYHVAACAGQSGARRWGEIMLENPLR